MRQIQSELADRLEGGAATLCHAWTLTRVDGVRMGFTDHDRDLTADGVLCRASSGWTAGAAEGQAGLDPGTATVSGALDHEAIREADVVAGLYDGAQAALWRVDWARPDLSVRLWAGRIRRIVRQGEAFSAELEGPMAALDRVTGRAYGRMCDAALGDERCGVDLTGRADAVCDKRWSTCVATFANGMRFRGFPHVPGDDFLTAYPVEGGRHDGASRQ